MSEIKRFEWGHSRGLMHDVVDGDYVRYVDYLTEIAALTKERDGYLLALQDIASDCETQTSGSFGMQRLAGYANEAIKGSRYIDEFEKDEKIIELRTLCEELDAKCNDIEAMYSELYMHHAIEKHGGELADTETMRQRIEELEKENNKLQRIRDKFRDFNSLQCIRSHASGRREGRAESAQLLQDHINRGNGLITDGIVTAIRGEK
jgi:antirestriction protein